MLRVPQTSLLDALDPLQINCLNEDNEHNFKNLLASKKLNTSQDTYLLSDVDEQLLLNIPVRPDAIS